MEHILIIGNGVAGTTTARHLRKLNSKASITIISSESDYFFSRTALMYIYMGHMRFEHTKPYEDHFWKKNKIHLLKDHVLAIDFNNKEVKLRQNKPLSYDKLVLATGSKPRFLNWPGKELKGVQGLYSLQDLEALESNSKHAKSAVVVGGGLIGIELAEMLHSRNIETHFVLRERSFWSTVLPLEESNLITRHLENHGIHVHTNETLKCFEAKGDNQLQSAVFESGLKIDCDLAGVTIGVEPAISFLKDSPLKTDQGILINQFGETNLEDVYAIGDCAQLITPEEGRKAIEAVWYTAKNMGKTLAHTLTGNKTAYHQGTWFNSAKLFDIEYQVYGQMPAQFNASIKSFYWQHPSKEIAFRIAYNSNTLTVLGIHGLGLRLRMETCLNWIENKVTLLEAIEALEQANFDPEFQENHFKSIQNHYFSENGQHQKQNLTISNFYS